MSVLAIVVALLAEQWRPLDSRRTVQPVLEAWAGWLEHAFNGGEKSHGMVAWLAAGLPPAAAAIAIHHLLASGYLADHKVPQQILIVAEVPLGRTGKVQRRSLANRFAAALSTHY